MFQLYSVGDSRQESEYCALQYLQDKATDNCLIVIHDAARSFMSSELLTNLVNTAKEHGSAAPYLNNNKFYDIENDEIVANKKIVDIQTPQVYKYKELFECYSYLSKNNITGMVDTTESMFNFNKYETQVIRGEESNLKITYKSDLENYRESNNLNMNQLDKFKNFVKDRNENVKVGLVGAGQMGQGIVAQVSKMHGVDHCMHY